MSKMAKGWLIAAAMLILIGGIVFGGVMTMLNWDFSKLSTVKYQVSDYEITEKIQNISIKVNTANIVFAPSDDGKTKVVCYEQENLRHTVSVQDGSLLISVNDTRKWYDFIGIHFGSPQITLCLPETQYNDLSVHASTGSIALEDLSFASMDLGVTTGKVTLSNIQCADALKIDVSTGETILSDIACKTFRSQGSTGKIMLKNVIAAEEFYVKRSTGDVKLERCDGNSITVITDTGSIQGTLRSGKVFSANTDTGRIRIPANSGSQPCVLSTDTGNIIITIE